jgi:hypothetical protein
MNHLSEEQLIELYYSKDGPEAARHLDACGECARAYEALQADLVDLQPAPEPARDENYGRQVWAAIADGLPAYARPRTPWFRRPLWVGLSAACACALLIAAFYAGRIWEHQQQPHSIALTAPAAPHAPRVVVVVLSDHLERSERLLVELKHANADDAGLRSPLRDEARSLLAANRRCRQEAEETGDPELTKALDRLNALLTELADQPNGMSADAIARLQEQMKKDGLLFEVRVLRSRIPDHQAAATGHLKGGIA